MTEQEIEKIQKIMKESIQPLGDRMSVIEQKLFLGNGESITTQISLIKQSHENCQNSILKPIIDNQKNFKAQTYALAAAIILGLFNLAGILLPIVLK